MLFFRKKITVIEYLCVYLQRIKKCNNYAYQVFRKKLPRIC